MIAVLLGVVLFLALTLFLTLIMAFPVMFLWNFVMPLMGLPLIGYWQAAAIYLLCSLLFKSASSSSSS